MITTNYTAFRKGLKKFLDNVEQNNETVIIKRSTGKGAVLISTDKYNSITETIHLLGHKANAERLYESIIQMKEGRTGRKGVN